MKSRSSPRVSVLLPVRDAAATLDACLASLARQTLANHEVVAVDDGSHDGSRERLAAAARADPRLRLVVTPPLGLVAALNRAAAEARAPLLARMDADDVAFPQRLELQAERLAMDAELAILATRVAVLAEPGLLNAGMHAYVAWSNTLLEHAAIVADLLVESPLVHPSVMLRAQLLRQLGGYRELEAAEDYDLWLRAAGAGARFGKLPELLLQWRDRPERLTRRDPRYAPERFRARKLLALEAGPLRGGRPLVVWGAGRVGKAWARALVGRGHAVVAFVEVDPRKLGQSIHGARVIPVEAVRADGSLHLAAVGQPGARVRIRAEAARLGLVEGCDFFAVA